MVHDEALYEIATTDAWRHLLDMLIERQRLYEQEVIRVVSLTDFSPVEAARRAGSVEAIRALCSDLKIIGKKGQV